MTDKETTDRPRPLMEGAVLWIQEAKSPTRFKTEVGAEPQGQKDPRSSETDFPGGPEVETLLFHCRGPEFDTLVGELRCCML